MTHETGTRDAWLAARLDLLRAEKELTPRSYELARGRQERPRVPIASDANGAADWLSFAAAPIFAVMALLTAVAEPPDMLCSAAHGWLSLSGMMPMYVLMSVFHSAPWLRLILRRRSDAYGSRSGRE
jgi:Bacterial protein of unknown function (DUF899)